MNTVEEVLQNCTIKGKVVFLPDEQLERKLYLQVSQKLEFIGGKWNRKERGFLFEQFPDELLERIKEGENVNLKKEFQFFETPSELAMVIVDLCEFEPGMDVLEPSAGKGGLLRHLPSSMHVSACEINPLCFPFLNKEFPNVQLYEGDFMNLFFTPNSFDRVIANPPFTNNQDIDHIEKMYELCRPGGRIVTVASRHWQIASTQKETRFREWLDSLDNEIIPVEAGTFKQSGTMIPSVIIVINK
jgi:SAM-dependent methyltransferase